MSHLVWVCILSLHWGYGTGVTIIDNLATESDCQRVAKIVIAQNTNMNENSTAVCVQVSKVHP